MFQLYLRKNSNNKLEVEKFVLQNGKVIENKGVYTDFSWLSTHIAKRITLIEDDKQTYEATFFYAEYNGQQIIVEIGELQVRQTMNQRKIS